MNISEIELWGGIECTVNRVGDVFFDQVERTGHAERMDDLERLAALGVRAVRYPILWERTARGGLEGFDFSWADARMQRLRELGIRVIVGLVHHGSGPRGTSLLEDDFIRGLSRFALAVAERYPWVEDYTPVNEPLTTARFSALYGHWYPHARGPKSFVRALLVQTRATVAAMRAIRTVVPTARLVQTEDFGSVFSTPKLKYQADFENHRKWLSLDLLFGKVTPKHPLFGHLMSQGAAAGELLDLAERPCPPGLIGVNYYVTSDRFLDDRVSRYPANMHGSNGKELYVDVEAVRVRHKGIVGHRDVLTSAWERYATPLALTEVHLGCTPEEQVRWLHEAWEGARAASQSGADIRAVTLWSVFGAYDWDSLVTRPQGHYEPGAFDVRGPTPHPTAVAHVAEELGRYGHSLHPLLEAPGWWRRSQRLLHSVTSLEDEESIRPTLARQRPILITGGGGALAEAFRKACDERGLPHRVLSRAELDIADASAVERAIVDVNPWLVVNAAGIAWTDEGFEDPARCFRENVEGARIVAEACCSHRARLVTFSSALVFDGEKRVPYVETDAPSPAGVLGMSHAAAERLVLGTYADALVVRSGALFSASPASGRLWDSMRRLERGEAVPINGEVVWSLAFTPAVAHTCLNLAMAFVAGIVHLSHAPDRNLLDFTRDLAGALGIDSTGLLATSPPEACGISARLPASAVMSSVRVAELSDMGLALERIGREVRAHRIQLSTGQAA